MFFQFEKNKKPVKPEKISIKIIAHATDYNDPQKTRIIDGENYISTFGTFQSNVNDGTDFSENETFSTPVEPI